MARPVVFREREVGACYGTLAWEYANMLPTGAKPKGDREAPEYRSEPHQVRHFDRPGRVLLRSKARLDQA